MPITKSRRLSLTRSLMSILIIALAVTVISTACAVSLLLPGSAGADGPTHDSTLIAKNIDVTRSLTITHWAYEDGDRMTLAAYPATLWTNLDPAGEHPGWRMYGGRVSIEVGGQLVADHPWLWPCRMVQPQGRIAYECAIIRAEDQLSPVPDGPGRMVVHITVDDAPDVERMTIGVLGLSIH